MMIINLTKNGKKNEGLKVKITVRTGNGSLGRYFFLVDDVWDAIQYLNLLGGYTLEQMEGEVYDPKKEQSFNYHDHSHSDTWLQTQYNQEMAR